MTSLQNGCVRRKSSVYNQTGQNYFEQLSAYNCMRSHLRRVLLAESVVDSRNDKYAPEKKWNCKTSHCPKALDQIVAKSDIIDELVYDTENHPKDTLRMNLGCYPECHRRNKKKKIGEENVGNCGNNRPATSRRNDVSSETRRRPRTCNVAPLVNSNAVSSPTSGRSPEVTGNRSDREPEMKRSLQKISNQSPSRCKKDGAAVTADQNYYSSFESASEASELNSTVEKKKNISSCRRCSDVGRRHDKESTKRHNRQQQKHLFNNGELCNEEAKYAKFIYDITEDIMLNGLCTDEELQKIFKIHVEMNSGILDKNKMLSEIDQLKTTLNVDKISDTEEENNPARFVGSGKFAYLSPEQPPTPPKVLNENKFEDKLKNHLESWRFNDPERRSKHSQGGKNTVVLVDANPEMLITERDVLLTLTEMKLEPEKVRTIYKSLYDKSREIGLSQTVSVQCEASSHSERTINRGNAPLSPRSKVKDSNSFFKSGAPSIGKSRIKTIPNKAPNYACQCGEQYSPMSDLARANEEKPEVDNQTSILHNETQEIMGLLKLPKSPTSGNQSKGSEPKKASTVSKTPIKNNKGKIIRSKTPRESFKREGPVFSKKSPALSTKDETTDDETTKDSTATADRDKRMSRSIRKSSGGRKTSPSKLSKKSMDDLNASNSTFDKSSDDQDSLSRRLTKNSSINDNEIPEDFEETETEVTSEADPLETVDEDKNNDIVNDELASLPEEISQVEESERSRDSSVSKRKSKTLDSEAKTDDPNIHVIDDSENEEISISEQLDPDSRRDSEIHKDSGEFELGGKSRNVDDSENEEMSRDEQSDPDSRRDSEIHKDSAEFESDRKSRKSTFYEEKVEPDDPESRTVDDSENEETSKGEQSDPDSRKDSEIQEDSGEIESDRKSRKSTFYEERIEPDDPEIHVVYNSENKEMSTGNQSTPGSRRDSKIYIDPLEIELSKKSRTSILYNGRIDTDIPETHVIDESEKEEISKGEKTDPDSRKDSKIHEDSGEIESRRKSRASTLYRESIETDVPEIHIVDDSETEEISKDEQSDPDSRRDSKLYKDSTDIDSSVKSRKNTLYRENSNNEKKRFTFESIKKKLSIAEAKGQDENKPSSFSEERKNKRSIDSRAKRKSSSPSNFFKKSKSPSTDSNKEEKQSNDGILNICKIKANCVKKARGKKARDSRKSDETPQSIKHSDRRCHSQEKSPSKNDSVCVKEPSSSARKKTDGKIRTSFLGKIMGRSVQLESATTTPKMSVTEDDPSKTILHERTTTASDISLLNKQDLEESSINIAKENTVETEGAQNELTSKSESRPVLSPNDVVKEEDDMAPEEDKLEAELNSPVPSTSQHQSSFIESFKTDTGNLIQRKNTNEVKAPEVNGERISSSDTAILRLPKEDMFDRNEDNLKNSSSEDVASNTSLFSESEENPPMFIEIKRNSVVPTNHASTGTETEATPAEDDDPSALRTTNWCKTDCRGFWSDWECQSRYKPTNVQLCNKFISSGSDSEENEED